MNTNGPWNLFAILGDEPDVRRVLLAQSVQAEVTQTFLRQYEDLRVDERELVPYDPGLKPDDSEIFVIGEYELPQRIAEAVGNPLSSEAISDSEDDLAQIRALFLADSQNERVLFQTFDRRQVLSRKRLTLVPASGTFGRLESSGFLLGSRLAAVYENDTLLFESFFSARRVLDLTLYFEAATDEEIAAFASHSKLNTEESDLIENADSWVRRKVALIRRSEVLESVTVERVAAAGLRYDLSVETDQQGRIRVPAEKRDLKALLRLLDEAYFTSDLTSNRFLSNSKRRLSG